MKKIWLKVEAQEPLLLGDIKAGTSFLSTLPYIPGRILRGAWADWLIAHGREKDILATISEVHIASFFPTVEWRPIQYVSPFLLSALTCKQEGGFYTEIRPDRRGHGVLDMLIPQLAFYLLKEAGTSFQVPFAVRCKKCGDRMEQATGFYTVYQDGSVTRYVKTREHYHTQTKVAISRQRVAASEGMMYTATALSPISVYPDTGKKAHLIFVGYIHGQEEKVEELRQAVNAMSIGSLRTRGYGKICIKEALEVQDSLPLAERLEAFNQRLGELWGDLKVLVDNSVNPLVWPEGIYFSVDLLTPGIFRQHGLPSLVPMLDVDGQALKPIFWLTRPTFAGGWSTAWGLPKSTQLAAQMGSVYVFRWGGSKEALLSSLQRLEEEGIGERCNEGFGECLICHPFHQEVNEI